MGEKLKILQTCAGGLYAPALTRAFEDAGAEVILGDIKSLRPGIKKLCDPKNRFKYLAKVQEVCRDKNIIVYPHNYIEAQIVAEAKESGLLSAKALLPSLETLQKTHFKDSLLQELEAKEFPVVDYTVHRWQEIFLHNTGFVKPVDGFGGRQTINLDRIDMLEKCISMESFNLNSQEYTIDAIAKTGELIDFCIRKRLKAQGGICVVAEIVKNNHVAAYTKEFIEEFGWSGPLALQGFLEDDEFFITDVNARFGGGSPLSILAGWKGVENYVRLARGEEPIIDYEIKNCVVRRWYTEEILT